MCCGFIRAYLRRDIEAGGVKVLFEWLRGCNGGYFGVGVLWRGVLSLLSYKG